MYMKKIVVKAIPRNFLSWFEGWTETSVWDSEKQGDPVFLNLKIPVGMENQSTLYLLYSA